MQFSHSNRSAPNLGQRALLPAVAPQSECLGHAEVGAAHVLPLLPGWPSGTHLSRAQVEQKEQYTLSHDRSSCSQKGGGLHYAAGR
jgi:hypothetical protein